MAVITRSVASSGDKRSTIHCSVISMADSVTTGFVGKEVGDVTVDPAFSSAAECTTELVSDGFDSSNLGFLAVSPADEDDDVDNKAEEELRLDFDRLISSTLGYAFIT